jgi:dipeptidyl-peptidase III
VVKAKDKVDPAVYGRVLDFTKLFWANTGNHSQLTGQKFLPKFSADELKRALEQAGRKDLAAQLDELRQSLFDPDFEPLTTAKSPAPGKDIIQASANNFYSGVTLADLPNFTEHFRLNSRVVKEHGKLVEQVYRAGTPDGRVPPGLYAKYLRKSNEYFEKARAYASPEQAKVIADIICYYQTGERRDWIQFGSDWVRNNEPVDFANGFIEFTGTREAPREHPRASFPLRTRGFLPPS